MTENGVSSISRSADSPVVIVGAGPIGMMTALLLAQAGVRSILFDQRVDPTCPESRALAIQRDILALFDRVGLVEPILEKGLGWAQGRIFYRGAEVQKRSFASDDGSPYPMVVNLPQYDVERLLYDKIADCDLIDVRLNHVVTDVSQLGDGVSLVVQDSARVSREFFAAYLIGADGVRSTVRKMAGIPFEGAGAQGRFLVADFRAELPLAHERVVWFYPQFYPQDFVMMHSFDPTGWRLDWHISLENEEEEVPSPSSMRELIRNVVGEYEIELLRSNVYTYYQLQATDFRMGRVFLVGDAAHVFAPYGARGMNSGLEDADNLAWKLAQVLRNGGEDTLLDTYAEERSAAARFHSNVVSSAVEFMAPGNAAERRRRDEILSRAKDDIASAEMISSGRLYEPYPYGDSRLTARLDSSGRAVDTSATVGTAKPGDLAPNGYCSHNGSRLTLRNALGGAVSLLLVPQRGTGAHLIAKEMARSIEAPLAILLDQHDDRIPSAVRQLVDASGRLSEIYRGHCDTLYVVRPDCYLAVRADADVPLSQLGSLARGCLDIASGRAAAAS